MNKFYEKMSQDTQSSDNPPEKLSYAVHWVSSEDKAAPATSLHRRTPDTKGWLSEKMCDIPQQLVLKFDGTCRIDRISVLAHEYIIPSKIEFFAHVPEEQSAEAGRQPRSDRPLQLSSMEGAFGHSVPIRVVRLGFVSMDSNEVSHYKARELKTINLRVPLAVALQLNLHKCHPNTFNLYNQVGIVAISIYGKKLPASAGPLSGREPATAVADIQQSVDISQLMPSAKSILVPATAGPQSRPPSGRAASDRPEREAFADLDSKTAELLRNLTIQKEHAVRIEDYESAARIKKSIDHLRRVADEIAQLEQQKRMAVEEEDFERAKDLKLRIEQLRDPTAAAHHGHALQSLPRASGAPALTIPRLPLAADHDLPRGIPHGSSAALTSPASREQHAVSLDHRPPAAADTRPQSSPNASRYAPGLYPAEPELHSLSHRSPMASGLQPERSRLAGEHQLDRQPQGSAAVSPDAASVFDEKPVTGAMTYDQLLEGGEGPRMPGTGAAAGGSKIGGPSELPPEAMNVSPRTMDGFREMFEGLPPWERAAVNQMRKIYPTELTEKVLFDASRLVPAPNDARELQPFEETFGHLLGRCFLSPQWMVREASCRAVAAALSSLVVPHGGFEARFRTTDALGRRLVQDKMVQVCAAALFLMMRNFELQAGLCASSADPARASADLDEAIQRHVPYLLEKLADNNQKLREIAHTHVVAVCRLRPQDTRTVARFLLSPAFPNNSKHKKTFSSNSKFMVSRYELLCEMVQDAGVDDVFEGSKELLACVEQGLLHSNGHVRTATTEVIRAIFSISDENFQRQFRPLFAKLKPALAQEIEAAIHRPASPGAARRQQQPPPQPGLSGGGGSSTHPSAANRNADGGSRAADLSHAQRRPQGMHADDEDEDYSRSRGRRQAHGPALLENEDGHRDHPRFADDAEDDKWQIPEDNAQTCQFCGFYNPQFDEELLDEHYLHDCPMLSICKECGQVIELATLNDHLLHECAKKVRYEECPDCHFAMLPRELEKHRLTPCRRTDARETCRLCLGHIQPDDEWAWQKHYLTKGGCPKNPRKKVAPV